MTDAAKQESREQLFFQAAAQIQHRINEARKDPVAFIELVWLDQHGQSVKLEPFHKEWLQHLENNRRCQIEAPRNHAKTTIVLGWLLWRIGRNPNTRVKYFTQSDQTAEKRLKVLRTLIEKNKLVHMVFPHLAKDAPWHNTAFQVVREAVLPDPTFESAGILGSVEGGRADIMVLDDVSDYRTAIAYPQYREAIKRKTFGELMPMLESDGICVSLATPHHDADVVAAIRKNSAWASYVYHVGTDTDPCAPLWPGRWPREELEALRIELGPLEYDRAYRCKSVSSANQIIKREHIQYYDSALLGDPYALECFQAYDLAITEKRGSSYFACVTVLYCIKRDFIFVADAWHAKLGFAEQAMYLINGAREWSPFEIGIEETGYQKALREYLDEKAGTSLNIVPMKPGNKSKEIRLMETLPAFEAHKIYFNPRLNPELDREIANRGDLVTQLINFATSTDKDLSDAFGYAIKLTRSFKARYNDLQDHEEWDSDGDSLGTRLAVY
jgi:phage terminase large subunit-like protein